MKTVGLLVVVVSAAVGCRSGTPGAGPVVDRGDGPAALALGSYRVQVDPANPHVFSFRRLPPGATPLPAGASSIEQALANGNEKVELSHQAQFNARNCAPGVCGCGEAPDDLPSWFTSDCVAEGYVDYGLGRVVVENTSTDRTFVNPAIVLTNLQPAGVAVFAQAPSADGSCTAYRPRRTTTPYADSYYLRYGDIGPLDCSKGHSADPWIIAANTPGVGFSFDIHLLVDSLADAPWFDAPVFSDPIGWPARPQQRPPGLRSDATIGQSCTGVVPGNAVLCVAVGGSGSGQASAPFGSIQAAVDAAKSGDLIQIAQGDYRERVLIEGKSLTLRGGFTGSGDFSSSIPATRVTSILGPANDTALELQYADNVLITGLRLAGAGGKPAGGNGPPEGGGLYIEGGTARIEHNLIENNDTTWVALSKARKSLGGGVYASGCDLELHYNLIRGNRSGKGAVAAFGTVQILGNEVAGNTAIGDHGGGLYLAGASIEVIGNRIAANSVGADLGYGWGGGILVFDGSSRATLAHNVITGNSAPSIGSGVFIDDGAQALLVNELIYGNVCPALGGAGLYVDGLDLATPSAAYVVNATIALNTCGESTAGSAIMLEQRSAVKLRNSILWGNGGSSEIGTDGSSGARASYTLSATELNGEGNLSADPAFADPGSGDFHLRSTGGRWVPDGTGGGSFTTDGTHSPAIDGGNPVDPAVLEATPNGGRINLGAYGGTEDGSRSAP